MNEFGPLNLQPRPGKQWAPVIHRSEEGSTGSPRRRWLRATYKRTKGVRHLLAALDMNTDRLYGHIKTNKCRTTFLALCRYLRSLYPPEVRIAIVIDNFSPHLSTSKDGRVRDWAEGNNVDLAYVPTNASYLNRIECQLGALPRAGRQGPTGQHQGVARVPWRQPPDHQGPLARGTVHGPIRHRPRQER